MPERIHDNYLNVLIIGSTTAQYNVSTRTRPPMHIAILTFEGFNAPVGEKETYVTRAMANILPFL
ncbi:hypothetical protein AB4156_10505 [Cupriavidus sp. 2MCAB6]|uniref:hypothetical protein n=1 Tax=Cupriavidus sp. 2MCAB6 TaxID=3232981 RepID=UPI003F90293A